MLTEVFQEVKVEHPINEETLSRTGKVRFKKISKISKRFPDFESMVFFGEPHNKAGLFDQTSTLSFFSFPSFNLEKKMIYSKNRVNRVYCVIKWDNESFVFGSLTGWVLRVSIIPPYKTIQSIKLEDQVYESAKMNEKYLLCFRYDDIISLIDIPSNQLIREMQVGKYYSSRISMIPSKRFLNCFYTNTSGPIKLYDYIADELVNDFFGHNTDNVHFVVLENDRKQEIVVVCCWNKFYFYNTSTFKKGGNNSGISEGFISQCFSIGNRYIFATTYENKRKICVFKVGNENVKIVGGVEYKKKMFNFKCFPILEKNSKMKILTYYENDRVEDYLQFEQHEIEGIVLQDGQEYKDLEERILFIKDEFDVFMFSKLEKKNFLFQVRFVGGRSFEKCLRILFA